MRLLHLPQLAINVLSILHQLSSVSHGGRRPSPLLLLLLLGSQDLLPLYRARETRWRQETLGPSALSHPNSKPKQLSGKSHCNYHENNDILGDIFLTFPPSYIQFFYPLERERETKRANAFCLSPPPPEFSSLDPQVFLPAQRSHATMPLILVTVRTAGGVWFCSVEPGSSKTRWSLLLLLLMSSREHTASCRNS